MFICSTMYARKRNRVPVTKPSYRDRGTVSKIPMTANAHGSRSARGCGALLALSTLLCLAIPAGAFANESPPPSCPLPPDSFLDLGPFRPAFAFPNEEADREIKVRASKNQQPGSALSCWKLLELRAHQSLAEQEGLAASSTTSQNVPMTCGWPGGRWSQATYWLTATELDGEQHACPKLRQDLLVPIHKPNPALACRRCEHSL